MTWEVKAEVINGCDHLWYPETDAGAKEYLQLKDALDTLYDIMNDVLVETNLLSDLLNLMPNTINITLPSKVIIQVCAKVNGQFTISDFRLPSSLRSEVIIKWGLWPTPITYMHFNLYPWQDWFSVWMSQPFTDVTLIPDATFKIAGVTTIKDYMLSDLLKDASSTVLLGVFITLLAKYGFPALKDVYNSYMESLTVTEVAAVQSTLNTYPIVQMDTNITDTLTRVKKLYSGSYV